MKTKWRFTKINGKQPVIVNDATGGRITYLDDDVSDANALKLAAAQDLLAALQAMLAEYGDYHAPVKECTKQARAAIARAEGKA